MPLLALFRKLLLLCRQRASCTTQYLLKSIALLGRYIKSWRFLARGGMPGEKTGRHADDLEAKASDTCLGTDYIRPSCPLDIERGSVLACSVDITSVSVRASDSNPPRRAYSDPGPFSATDVEEGGRANEFQTDSEGSLPEESVEALERVIRPIAPSGRPRYKRNIRIWVKTSRWKFAQLGTYELYRSLDIPSGNFNGKWRYYVHPDGLPYYHLEHLRSGLSVLTEADLQDKDVFHEVESFMFQIQEYLDSFEWKSIGRPRKIEVVLEIQGGWYYYMVDVERQIVFWLDDFVIAHSPPRQAYGFGTADHCRPQLELEYWTHIELFPTHRNFKPEMYHEAFGALNYWRMDLITSADSTTPYDSNEILGLVESLRNLKSTEGTGKNDAYVISSLARIMTIVWNDRCLHFYGSPGARLGLSQSVRGKRGRERSSWFIKLLSPLLFSAPYSYLSGIERQWVDGVIQMRIWKEYRHKLEQGWGAFVLTSTVLLNANVAMLATPNVLSDNGDDNRLFASPAAVASQISIIASMGSIIIGLSLVSQVRTIRVRGNTDVDDFVEFVSIRNQVKSGLETLAILYSLPYALLMWGIAAFSTSIAISCFFRIDGWPTTPTRVICAVAWMLVVPLIIWTVITNWEMSNKKHWSHLFSHDLKADLQGKARDIKETWSRRMSRDAQDVPTDVDAYEMSDGVSRNTGDGSANDISRQATSSDIQNGMHSEGPRVTSCV